MCVFWKSAKLYTIIFWNINFLFTEPGVLSFVLYIKTLIPTDYFNFLLQLYPDILPTYLLVWWKSFSSCFYSWWTFLYPKSVFVSALVLKLFFFYLLKVKLYKIKSSTRDIWWCKSNTLKYVLKPLQMRNEHSQQNSASVRPTWHCP